MSDLVERLRRQAHICQTSKAIGSITRYRCEAAMTEAAARITELETALAEANASQSVRIAELNAEVMALQRSLAEAEGRVKWVFPKSIADMPMKPGKAAYEYVECLILRKGEMLARPWNCEHQVFDDEAQDDFFCEWSEVTAYMDLTVIRTLASDPLLDRHSPSPPPVV